MRFAMQLGKIRRLSHAASPPERTPDSPPPSDAPTEPLRIIPEKKEIQASQVRKLLLSASVGETPLAPFENLKVAGELDLEACKIEAPFKFINCDFDSRIVLRSAKLRMLSMTGCKLAGIWADDCHIEGSVHFDIGFESHGACSMRGAKIGGSIHFTGATFIGSAVPPLEPQAVDLTQCELGGSLFMNLGFIALGQVRLRGANIRSDLDCRGGSFQYYGKDALVCDGTNIVGNVLLNGSFKCVGKANFKGSTIGQAFRCEGDSEHTPSIQNVRNPGEFPVSELDRESGPGIGWPVGDSIDLSGAKVGQTVSLQKCTLVGGVRLNASTIGNDLNCSGAQIVGQDPQHLRIVEGDRQDFAIAARRSKIGGTVFLAQRFSAEGGLDFSDAHVGGSFRCIGATVQAYAAKNQVDLHRKRALVLTDARIEHTLVIRRPINNKPDEYGETSFEGDIDLTNLRVTSFNDDQLAWPVSGNVQLDGFTYSHIKETSSTNRANSAVRLKWLKKQPQSHLKTEFRLQPWHQLIQTFRSMGDTAGARKIAIAKNIAILNSGTLEWPEFFWNGFLRLTSGFGYRPLYSVAWSIFLVLAGWYFVCTAQHVNAFTPSAPVVQVARIEKGADWLPPGYPAFSSFWFTVDTFVPLLDLGQEDHWISSSGELLATLPQKHSQSCNAERTKLSSPLSGRLCEVSQAWNSAVYELIAEGWLPAAYRIYKILGWIMLTLCVAAFSGLLKDERLD